MKKKYFKPEMQVYEVKTQQLLQASTENFPLGDDPEDGNNRIY